MFDAETTETAMTPNRSVRPITLVPEVLGILFLGLSGLTPLVLSSGAEPFDWILYRQNSAEGLPRLEPLVGLDVWLHWIARLLLITGIVNIVVRRLGPVFRFHRVVRDPEIRSPRPGTDLHRLATRYGCLGSVQVLPRRHGPVAFTAGMLKPRIYVSHQIIEALNAWELELLLVHEIHHCRSNDPARSLIITLLADLFWWLPIVKILEDRVMAKIEFGADDAAAKLDSAGLAGTILKVAGMGAPRLSPQAVSFSPKARVVERVRRLLREDHAERVSLMTVRSTRSTILVLLAFWTLGFTAYGTHNAHQDTAAESYTQDMTTSAASC